MPPKRDPAPIRFWASVKRGPECWEWTASGRNGYGTLTVDGRMEYTHRYSWTLAHGAIPNGLHVLHHCDNRACVKTEPDEKYPEGHLFLGTRRDNMRDAMTKGRMRGALLVNQAGEGNPAAILTWQQVTDIRKAYAKGGITQRTLADLYGVSAPTISAIIAKRHWRD